MENLNDGARDNYNWLSNFKKIFLAPIQEEVVTDDLGCLREGERRSELLDKYTRYRRSLDINKSISSSSLLLYPSLAESDKKYLEMRKTLHSKALISQLRLLNRYNCRVIYRGNIYVLKPDFTCLFCNFSNLDITHFLFDCPLLENTRSNIKLTFPHDCQDKTLTTLSTTDEGIANALEKLFLQICKDHISDQIRIH